MQKKSVFIKNRQILYPFKNALWALRPCKAFGRSISASLPKPQTPSPWRRAVYALLALHLCNRGRLLSVRHAPTLFDHLYASLHRAFVHTHPASVPERYYWGYRP